MYRLLFTTALLVTATIATDASADHLDRLRREYELNRTELRNDFLARQEAYRFAFHRERDALLLERKRALQIDCPDTRAARVRSINRAIGELAREHGTRNRQLSSWYANESRNLRREYDFARNNLRRVATRPVIVDSRFRAHPADCSCATCAPPARPIIPLTPGCDFDRPVVRRSRYDVYDDFGYGGPRYYDGYRGTSSRPSKGLAIASLILGMLNN